MSGFVRIIKELFTNKNIRNKLLFTLGALLVYRMLVLIPVPFVDIGQLVNQTLETSGLGYFVMLL
ncbi:hypothetical protein KBA84_00515 [Patescibacteria group bacterium]|jgi:preprotein translocase subunit SecY|nr:hypothetical protein [Patescibacteria group bacterium]